LEKERDMKLTEFNLMIFSALLTDMVESFSIEFLAETQMIQNVAKLKPFKKEDSDKELWKDIAETLMPSKMDSLSLVISEKVKLKENTNHSESMEPQFKKVLKTDNK